MHTVQPLIFLIILLQAIHAEEVKFFKDCNFTRETDISQKAKPLYNTIKCDDEFSLLERDKHSYSYRVTYNRNRIKKVQYIKLDKHLRNTKIFFVLYYNSVGMLTREVDLENKFSVDYCLKCGHKIIDYKHNDAIFRKEVFYDNNNIQTNSITMDSNNSIIEMIQYSADNKTKYIYSNQGIKAIEDKECSTYKYPQCDIHTQHATEQHHLYTDESIKALCPPLDEYETNHSKPIGSDGYFEVCPEVKFLGCIF